MNPRLLNGLGCLACCGLMAYALYAEHVLGLEPCPLCVFQRLGVIGLGVVFALAAVHAPRGGGRFVYAAGVALTAGAGAAVAARHVWLQNLPPEQVPACGAGLDFLMDTLPFTEVVREVLSGSGECATISWSLLGLSMPTWVLIAFAGLGLGGIAANLLRPPARHAP